MSCLLCVYRVTTDWKWSLCHEHCVRLVTPDDARGVQEIYAPVVRETAISFELELPTVEEMQQRIVKTLEHWPW